MMDSIKEWIVELLSEPPSSVLQLIVLYVGALVAIIGAVVRGLRYTSNRLWPCRPKATWWAQAIPTPPDSDIHGQPQSDPNNAWRKDTGRWSNGKCMEVGDWYELYFEKPRVLAAITVRSEGQRFPREIKFLTKETRKDEWGLQSTQSIDVREHDQATIFVHKFNKNRKVEAIKLEIVEPTMEPRNSTGQSPAWAIYSMDFREFRLFGRWWSAPIT